MLLRVQIEHPGDQRTLEPCAGALQQIEARPAELDATIEVDDIERRPQIPVRLRLEVEHARRALGAQDDVLGVVLPHRHAGMRQVGDVQHRLLQRRVHLDELLIQRLDLVADLAHVRLERLALGALPFPHQLADLFRSGVALGPQRLDPRQDGAPPLIQCQGLDHRHVGGPQRLHRPEHLVSVLAHDSDVQHDFLLWWQTLDGGR